MTPRELPLDDRSIQVAFSVRWFGVVTVSGRFTRVQGRVQWSGDASTAVAVLIAESASISTGIALRDRHLRAARFLNADLHPWIRVTAEHPRVEHGRLVLDLRVDMRGATSTMQASCPVDEWVREGDQTRLCARFTISRTRHEVGVARGVRRFNPLLRAIADDVALHVHVALPAAELAQLGFPLQGARPRATTGQVDST